MDDFQFRIGFLSLFVLGVAVEWVLHFLNRREIRKHLLVPPSLAGLNGAPDPETFAKSRAYSHERASFAAFSLLFNATVTLVLLFSGGLARLDRMLLHSVGEGLNRNVLLLAALTAIPVLLNIPLSCYSTFRIEGKYGFNTMSWDLFWRDGLKQVFLALTFGIPLLYAVFFFMAKAGPDWWLWAFGLILVFQIIILGVYPILIAPFFNRFRPLPEGELKTSLLTMVRRLQFPAADIYVMDGSRRSLHANAYFMGIGKWRRIVLYDTLLHQLENRELLSVVAHEIGHYKHKHIYQQVLMRSLFLGAMLYMASCALQFAPLYGAFGFAADSGHAIGIFIFLSCLSSVSIWMMPIQNLVSRHFEYAADAYAVKANREPEALGLALTKLAGKNLSNFTPHPWYSAFYHSHPKLEDRLKAL